MVNQYMRWQALIAAVGIFVVLLTLAGASTNVETVIEPEPGGTFIEGLPDAPTTFNPLYAQPDNSAEQTLLALVYNSLTEADVTGNIVPDLAESWVISRDESTYTFDLRDDVLWHDGTPFTAEDVAFTVDVIRDPAFAGTAPAIELWRRVTVEVVDAHTIRFVLPEDVVPFAPFLTYTTFPILPAHLLQNVAVEELPRATLHPVGTGSWRVTAVTGLGMTLEPNPVAEWPGRAPMLDSLAFRFFEDVGEAVRALNRNEVMGVANVPPANLPSVLANDQLVPYFSPASGYTALFFNLSNPLFQPDEVREALLVGLDRQEIVNAVLQGQGVVADSFLMPGHWAYTEDIPIYRHNLARANRLLDEAGWEDSDDDGIREREGKPVRLSILTFASEPVLAEVADELARQYEALGIAATPELLDSASQLRETLREREFDLFVLSTPSNGLPADPDFFPLWHSSQISENGQNYTSFSVPEADRLLIQARSTLNQDERRAAYAEFQEILATELPAFPLYRPITNYVVSALVKEVQVGPALHPGDRFESLPLWYIREKRHLREVSD